MYLHMADDRNIGSAMFIADLTPRPLAFEGRLHWFQVSSEITMFRIFEVNCAFPYYNDSTYQSHIKGLDRRK